MSDICVRFGAVLKAWRARRRLTQEALAERSGLSYKFIGEVERGTGNPTIETVSRLAAALGVGVSELFTDGETDDAAYRLSKRDIQIVREAAESLDSVMHHLTVNPAARYRRRRKRQPL